MTKYIEVKPNDSHKVRAVIVLLEQHAIYKNLSLQQIEALKDVISFVKELPVLMDKATELPQAPELTEELLKQEATKRGYVLTKAV